MFLFALSSNEYLKADWDSKTKYVLGQLPPDYILSSVGCLQGIFHALMLPGGNAITAALLRKSTNPLAPDPPTGFTSASYVAGLPESVNNAAQIANTLNQLIDSNPAVAIEFSQEQTTMTNLSVDNPAPCIVANLSESHRLVVSQNALAEPSVVLATSGSSRPTATPTGDSKNSEINEQDSNNGTNDSNSNFTAIFTNRTKVCPLSSTHFIRLT